MVSTLASSSKSYSKLLRRVRKKKWTADELRTKALERLKLKPESAEYKRWQQFATIKEMEDPMNGDLGLVNIIKNKVFASRLKDQWKQYYQSTSEDKVTGLICKDCQLAWSDMQGKRTFDSWSITDDPTIASVLTEDTSPEKIRRKYLPIPRLMN